MFAFLFNPFHKIAGYKALVLGSCIVALTALLALLFNTHFSGVVDIKYGSDLNLSYTVFLLQGFVNLFSVAALMYLASLFLSGSSVRFVDVAGTQALARTPFIVAPFLNASGLIERGGSALVYEYLNHGEKPSLTTFEWGLFVFFILIMVVVIIWAVALMFNAYRVSCNIKGRKAVISFVIIIIMAEILSLLLNHHVLKIFTNL